MDSLIYLVVIFGALFVIFSMIIISKLENKGVKINYLLIRFLIPSYVSKYREITKKEHGRTGILFYLWIASINIALLCFLVYLVNA